MRNLLDLYMKIILLLKFGF